MANGYDKLSRRELMKAILAVICSNGGTSPLPAPTGSNFSLSFNGAFVLANANPVSAPSGVTSAQLWTSTDGVNYTLNQVIVPPIANNTSVPPPATGTVLFGKFRWCAGSACGPFGVPIKITANSNLFNSLISYWKMDENIASGTRADSAGTNNLTDVNSNVASSATGILGRSVSITSASGMRLNHSDNASLSGGAGVSFSISLWARNIVVVTNTPLLSKFSATLFDYILYQAVTTANLTWQARNLANNAFASVTTGAQVPINVWTFIACGYDDPNQQLWIQVNNNARITAAIVGVQRTAANFTVGGYDTNTDGTWDGLLDEVGFWQRVLSSAEVLALYNSGAALAYPFS